LAFVDHLLGEFVSNLHFKKLQSINIFLHSTILKNILNKKLLDHILYLFPHLLLVVMLICCGLKMDMVFILNYLIFLILFKFMLKHHVDDVANAKPSYLQTLQMLKPLMLLTMKLVILLLFCFHNSITL
jgi:hypothetical protein